MSVKQGKVSPAFLKSFAKKEVAVQNAKKAENNLNSIPMPIGWEGDCLITDLVFDELPEKVDPVTKKVNPPSPFVRIEFSSTDEQFKGKKLSQTWWLNATTNSSEEDRLTWMFNGLEACGLPREIREKMEHPSEICEWFLDSSIVGYEPRIAHIKVVKDTWFGSTTGKKIQIRQRKESLEATSTVSPQKEGFVTFLGVEYKIEEDLGDRLRVTSSATGREKTIAKSDLQ